MLLSYLRRARKPRFLAYATIFTALCLAACLSGLEARYTKRLAIPARPGGAMTGSEFIKRTASLSEAQREEAILREITKGNVPSFLRKLIPVDVKTKIRGKTHTATVWVTPDYMAIGSDGDFVRIPMTPMTAQKIASRFGAMLPTPLLVDRIYQQAELKLRPSPLQVRGERMGYNDTYLKHQRLIERQRGGRATGELIAGHKKDIVLTNRLVWRPHKVAIYGWHRRGGKAIQPLSLVHHDHYADYSHGVRLVSRNAEVDGRATSLDRLLRDPKLARLVSGEGKMSITALKTSGGKNGFVMRKKASKTISAKHIKKTKKSYSKPKKSYKKTKTKYKRSKAKAVKYSRTRSVNHSKFKAPKKSKGRSVSRSTSRYKRPVVTKARKTTHWRKPVKKSRYTRR